MSFGASLANAGYALQGAQDRGFDLNKQKLEQMRQKILLQQYMQQISQQQQDLKRKQDAAAAAWGAFGGGPQMGGQPQQMGGIPQNVAMPGAQPMPQQMQRQPMSPDGGPPIPQLQGAQRPFTPPMTPALAGNPINAGSPEMFDRNVGGLTNIRPNNAAPGQPQQIPGAQPIARQMFSDDPTQSAGPRVTDTGPPGVQNSPRPDGVYFNPADYTGSKRGDWARITGHPMGSSAPAELMTQRRPGQTALDNGAPIPSPSQRTGGAASFPSAANNYGRAPVRDEGFMPTSASPSSRGSQNDGTSGGGITIAQFMSNLRSNNPNIDPQTAMEALSQAMPILKQDEQIALKELQLRIQQQLADQKGEIADWKTSQAQNGSGAVSRRMLENQARKIGVDPTGKSDAELNGIVADRVRTAPPKATAAERRAEAAGTDVKSTIRDIKKIIASHPGSVGVYGRGATIGSKVAGALGQEASEDAKAAAKLKPLFTMLEQRLGVFDSAGSQGGSAYAKQWKESLASGDWTQSPELLMDELDQLEKSATARGNPGPPELGNDGWGEVEVHP